MGDGPVSVGESEGNLLRFSVRTCKDDCVEDLLKPDLQSSVDSHLPVVSVPSAQEVKEVYEVLDQTPVDSRVPPRHSVTLGLESIRSVWASSVSTGSVRGVTGEPVRTSIPTEVPGGCPRGRS